MNWLRQLGFDIHIAMRNILRTPRRSFLMMLGVILATAMMCFSIGITEGSHNSMISMQANLITGLVQIQHPDYLDDPSLDNLILNSDTVVEAIEADPVFQQKQYRITQRISSGALISFGDNSRGVMLTGMDWEREKRFGALASRIAERMGVDLQEGEIALGKELAEGMEIKEGDEIVLVGFTSMGSINPVLLKVVAIFDSGLLAFNKGSVIVNLAQARAIIDEPGSATDISITADHKRHTETILGIAKNAISTIGPIDGVVLKAHPWNVVNKGLDSALKFDKSQGYVMLAVMMLIAAVAAANSMLLSQLERTREYGLMMSVGVTRKRLYRMIVAEGFLLVTIGALLGLAVGAALVYYFELNPIYMEEYEEMAKLYGMEPAIPGELNYKVWFNTPIIMWTLCSASLLVICTRIFRLKPLDAMRYTP